MGGWMDGLLLRTLVPAPAPAPAPKTRTKKHEENEIPSPPPNERASNATLQHDDTGHHPRSNSDRFYNQSYLAETTTTTTITTATIHSHTHTTTTTHTNNNNNNNNNTHLLTVISSLTETISVCDDITPNSRGITSLLILIILIITSSFGERRESNLL